MPLSSLPVFPSFLRLIRFQDGNGIGDHCIGDNTFSGPYAKAEILEEKLKELREIVLDHDRRICRLTKVGDFRRLVCDGRVEITVDFR